MANTKVSAMRRLATAVTRTRALRANPMAVAVEEVSTSVNRKMKNFATSTWNPKQRQHKSDYYCSWET